MKKPRITIAKGLSMQLCVPKEWSEEQIIELAEKENPCGTSCGWVLAKYGDACLMGSPAAVECADDKDMKHVVVQA